MISKSLAKVVGTPSYGDPQFPEVDLQALSVTTFVPSRLSTVSRVSQVPETSIQDQTWDLIANDGKGRNSLISQVLNLSLEYAGELDSAATVTIVRDWLISTS